MKHWLLAFRLRTLFLAMASTGMGTFLAASRGNFNVLIFMFCTLTTVCLQVLSNLANDYGDAVHGADNVSRRGPERAVQSGAISKRAMRLAILIFVLLSLLAGLGLLYIAFGWQSVNFLIFLGIGMLAIVAAITYTVGYKPYGYAGLGDLSVLIFFGFVAVMGTAFLFEKNINLQYILPALSIGAFAVAVLNVNNIRDMTSDLKAGKKSIPVRIGRDAAVRYHYLLLFTGAMTAIVYVLLNFSSWFQFLFVLVFPLLLMNASAVRQKKHPAQLDPFLRQMALSTFLFSLLFGLGQLF